MRKKYDLTVGSVPGNLFRLSIPLILMNILQAVYNIADMAIAGHFVGAGGMAAINTGGQITNIILMLIIGFSNGANIVTGQMKGAGETGRIRTVVKTTMVVFGLLAVGIVLICAVFCNQILDVLHIPPEISVETGEYLIICLCGTVFVYLYNALAGVLRGLGDSLHPMFFVVISTCVNIGLDYVLMGPLSMGVRGASLATISSQALSMILIILFFRRKTDYLTRGSIRDRFDPRILKMIVRTGLPQALQFSATQFSMLIIVGMVNIYGVTVAAAVGASNKAVTFAQLPGQALNAGVLTTTAQNLPKKNFKRIIHSMFWAMGTAIAIAMVFFLLSALCPAAVLGIFTDEQSVIRAGTAYLILVGGGCLIESIIYTSTGVVSGAGYTPLTMLAAMLSAFGRIVIAVVLQHVTSLGYYSLGVATVLAPIIPVVIMVVILISGLWKKSALSREI